MPAPPSTKPLEVFELCKIYCGPKKGRRMLYHLQKKKKRKRRKNSKISL